MAALHQQRAELRDRIGQFIEKWAKEKNRDELIKACGQYHAAYTNTLSVSELKVLLAIIERDDASRSATQGTETPQRAVVDAQLAQVGAIG